ncbi:amidase [Sporosarcina sp. P18a]|uniref:amidase n=1 Tax=Sporosarcina sp. P18a TaxID=2048259 RepID=UPI000C16D4A0|nr:amidase [Sporosarcina sp. P18a]PIC79019.1 amidase [Sporosarcina sp. P18a]
MSKKSRSIWMVAILLILSNFIWLKPMLTMRIDQPKATWLWHTSQILNQSSTLIEFLDKKNVSTLYLQINADIPNDAYQRFIRKASERNIEVHALDGAPYWATDQQSAQNFFQWVEKYQSVSENTEQFTGIHLDIEPYILPTWDSNLQGTVQSYQQNIRFAADKSANLGLHFGIDIPFWFDSINYSNVIGEGVLSEWLIDQSDSINVMAYRNKADGHNGMISLAKSEINYASVAGKQARVAIETSKSSEGDYLSFFGKNNAYMEKQLKEVERSFSHAEGFRGIAIHSLESWMIRK